MTEKTLHTEDLSIEGFLPEHKEAVTDMLLGFVAARSSGDVTGDLGLVFEGPADTRHIEPVVDGIFDAHPELEDERRELDHRWWDQLSEEHKKQFEGDEEIFKRRAWWTRRQVAYGSLFVGEIHKANVQHHVENSDAHRYVVRGHERVLGYLAAWTGPSTLYIDDDHMQIDAKVVDLGLSIEEQKLVVAEFEPILYDLSLP
jgi:hypothetical protein